MALFLGGPSNCGGAATRRYRKSPGSHPCLYTDFVLGAWAHAVPAVNTKLCAIAVAVQKKSLGPTIPMTERAISPVEMCAADQSLRSAIKQEKAT